MKAALLGALAQLHPRWLMLGMALTLCLAAFEGWHLALRKPYHEYMKASAVRATLASAISGKQDAQGELSRLAAELLRLAERLSGELRLPASDDQMVAELMTQLDRSAQSGEILLSGIRPGARRRVLSFEEASFDITAQGSYKPLCQWLIDFERTLGRSATVSDFTMKSIDEGRRVALTVRVVLYRALPETRVGT